MPSALNRSAFIAAAVGAILGACGGGGETREWSTGKAVDGYRPDPTTTLASSAESSTTIGGVVNPATLTTMPVGGSDPVGGDNGTTAPSATPVPLSKTLEQCEAAGQAWVAVVESGSKPSVCGDQLVDWCCTESEIYGRFPGSAGLLKQRIDENKAAKYILYHCSIDNTGKHTFHMAQIGDNFIKYKTIFVSGVNETDTGNAGRAACMPKPTTAMLRLPAG